MQSYTSTVLWGAIEHRVVLLLGIKQDAVKIVSARGLDNVMNSLQTVNYEYITIRR